MAERLSHAQLREHVAQNQCARCAQMLTYLEEVDTHLSYVPHVTAPVFVPPAPPPVDTCTQARHPRPTRRWFALSAFVGVIALTVTALWLAHQSQHAPDAQQMVRQTPAAHPTLATAQTDEK